MKEVINKKGEKLHINFLFKHFYVLIIFLYTMQFALFFSKKHASFLRFLTIEDYE
jgi:hypothetical protein